ncbi:MAG: hypothetical protein A4S09_04080 [Proteobacteria bacterium SG_bin7]|nr:MAG: hypothetical protein A4S09_04080 [Proteobacteria bacterium SG_bin7]
MDKNKLQYIDISPLVSSKTAVYPQDTPFSRKVELSFSSGDKLELSSMTTSLHIGAHTDAPNHYKKGLPGIDQRDLSFYLGPCQVIEVKAKRGERINIEHLGNTKISTERVLLKTSSFPNPDQWNEDFNSYSPELVEYLYEKKVILVGIDTPSIDPANSINLESHQVVAKNDMSILEGIVLDNVPPGEYILCALPLRLKDCDASPVRAILLGARQPLGL